MVEPTLKPFVLKPGRILCCVIGCRRTAPQEKYPGCTKIICGKCWQLAPPYFRRRVRRIEKLARKMGVDLDNIVQWPAPFTIERRLMLLHARAFDRLQAAAIERKVGISA
jgi:hypothetical protein